MEEGRVEVAVRFARRLQSQTKQGTSEQGVLPIHTSACQVEDAVHDRGDPSPLDDENDQTFCNGQNRCYE